jgi:hypothetical protein
MILGLMTLGIYGTQMPIGLANTEMSENKNFKLKLLRTLNVEPRHSNTPMS